MTPHSIRRQLQHGGHFAPRSALDEPMSKQLLTEYGITVPSGTVISPQQTVAGDLAGLRPPLALKLISPGVLHKSDAGGVRLHLHDAGEVNAAMRAITEAASAQGHSITGFLLEEMAPEGHEVVIGGLVDSRFGPVIMVGLGGVFIEVLADVAFRVCPIGKHDARDMIGQLRGAAVLAGARGGIVAATHCLVDAMLRVGGRSGLLTELAPVLREIDINPIIVSASGAVAVDARIIVA